MASEAPRQYVPLTCHGHSRPVPHINFSSLTKDENYYMISACKDGNPMLRDGKTGDWIGTFIGHKGAVWQAKLSPDAATAATASADFTAKIWDTHTGELLYTLQHDHIVRALAYPSHASDMVATGGFEKKLRIFDLAEIRPQAASPAAPNAPADPVTITSNMAFEIGEGVHTDSIKCVVWTKDPTTLITASGKTLRWFDIASRSCIKTVDLDGEIKSCELVSLAPQYSSPSDIGGGLPVLAVAAGKTVSFWGGDLNDTEIKRFDLAHGVASVGLDVKGNKFVVGEEPGTWVRVYSWDDGRELDVLKGHHGPVWSVAFSPDGKLYATGSEDGTIKMWKNCEGFYGLWRGGANTVPERNADYHGGNSKGRLSRDARPASSRGGQSGLSGESYQMISASECSAASDCRQGTESSSASDAVIIVKHPNPRSPGQGQAQARHEARSESAVALESLDVPKQSNTRPQTRAEGMLSPGDLKKQLFLQKLERRGLSFSDPNPRSAPE